MIQTSYHDPFDNLLDQQAQMNKLEAAMQDQCKVLIQDFDQHYYAELDIRNTSRDGLSIFINFYVPVIKQQEKPHMLEMFFMCQINQQEKIMTLDYQSNGVVDEVGEMKMLLLMLAPEREKLLLVNRQMASLSPSHIKSQLDNCPLSFKVCSQDISFMDFVSDVTGRCMKFLNIYQNPQTQTTFNLSYLHQLYVKEQSNIAHYLNSKAAHQNNQSTENFSHLKEQQLKLYDMLHDALIPHEKRKFHGELTQRIEDNQVNEASSLPSLLSARKRKL